MVGARSTLSNIFRDQATVCEGRELSDLLSFRERPDLLRATPLTTLLRRGGRIFRASEGCAASYELSRPTEFIDVFLSHNWCVPRGDKYLALCFHFNFGVSVASLLVAAGVIGAVAFATGPVEVDSVGLCSVLAPPWFFMALFLARDIRAMFGFRDASCFLDKVCIHQTDKELQRQGIGKLGAFLRKSDRMLILYSDQYLVKLWTVFELASFLTIKHISKITVLTPRLGKIYVLACLSLYSLTVFLALTTRPDDNTNVYYGLFFPYILALVYTWQLRRWARDRQAAQARLASFSVAACTCFCEDDRPLVQRSIVLLLKAKGMAPVSATEAEALRAFDRIIQAELPALFQSMFGWCSFEYRHYMLIGLLGDGLRAIDRLTMLGQGADRWVLIGVLDCLVWTAIIWPILLVSLEVLGRRCLARRRLWTFLWINTASMLVLVPGTAVFTLQHELLQAALDSDAALVALVVELVVGVPLTKFFTCDLFGCRRRVAPPSRRRRRSLRQSGEEDLEDGDAVGTLGSLGCADASNFEEALAEKAKTQAGGEASALQRLERAAAAPRAEPTAAAAEQVEEVPPSKSSNASAQATPEPPEAAAHVEELPPTAASAPEAASAASATAGPSAEAAEAAAAASTSAEPGAELAVDAERPAAHRSPPACEDNDETYSV